MCNPIGKLVKTVASPLSLPMKLMEKNKMKPKDFLSGGATLFIGGDKHKNRTVNKAPTNVNTGLTDNLL